MKYSTFIADKLLGNNKKGGIGLYVDIGTTGYFRDLKVTKNALKVTPWFAKKTAYICCKKIVLTPKDDSTLNFRQQILCYFKPKTFEYYRGKTIYELIGIKTYKKYLPTTGDIVRQKRKIIQIRYNKTDQIDELYKYERKTRNYEWRHIIGTLVFLLLTLLIDRKLTVFDWIFLPLLNLYINIYPIFLQRYNRIRIIKFLQRNGRQSPYAK